MRLFINIPSGTTVNGNIKEEDSSADFNITVASSAKGYFNIENKGDGDVHVTVGDRDMFNGNIKDEADGSVRLTVESGGVFNGNVEEEGAGDVDDTGPGTFSGNIKEEDSGDRLVEAAPDGVNMGNVKGDW